jgi:ketosteroid isomerase-like protein
VQIILLGRVRIERDDRPCSADVVVGEDATGVRWCTVKRHAGLASGRAIGQQRRRRRKSAKVQLLTDDRGKTTIDDGSSSRIPSTPFSFGNCLMPAVELDTARLVGGSEADRSRVLERVHEYLEANASFDWGQLQDIWSGAPEGIFFNLNGHTYKGREHWTRLWQFYQPNVRSGYWTPFDLGGVVSNDLAVIWCERQTQSEWIGRDPPPQARRYGVSFISRSTMVFRKEAGDWRVVHVHFSEASTAPRPGGI